MEFKEFRLINSYRVHHTRVYNPELPGLIFQTTLAFGGCHGCGIWSKLASISCKIAVVIQVEMNHLSMIKIPSKRKRDARIHISRKRERDIWKEILLQSRN